MEFNLQLEYENFTVLIPNFDLTAVDLDPFEKVGLPLDFKTENIIVPIIALQRNTPILGEHSNSDEGERKRATQVDS